MPLYLFCCMLKRLTPHQAWEKIKHYCAYQERCHEEVKQKLYGYGLYTTDVDQLIGKLIEENYLNEERFAIAFAGGKFRMKHWGRVRIAHEMKQKRISSYNIKMALNTIDTADYRNTLQKLAAKKNSELKGGTALERKAKLFHYLQHKGFEHPLISEAIKALEQGEALH
jgi:regulatory protein